ncbi:MAG: hypothetical protein A2W80_05570 [Candidatus Riflebacteria bacterium GWC2_50_8]|nr:MAG: hypothetical protein A2W80_05570 [Candidatus Riflebacteria bacterium GWC2_50_8]
MQQTLLCGKIHRSVFQPAIIVLSRIRRNETGRKGNLMSRLMKFLKACRHAQQREQKKYPQVIA